MYPSDLLERPAYLSHIQPFIGKRLIKVLTGQRRVGKSYLLFQIMRSIQAIEPHAHLIYINKEDLAFDKIQTANDLHEYVLAQKAKSGTSYIFIDEIQEIQSFEKALRSLLLQEDIDIYCTGSNANLLSGELATLLSGRFIEFQVFSLSYQEFLQFHKKKDSDEALHYYMKYGGLPYLIHLPLTEENVIFEYLKNIYATIIYRDVVQRNGVRSSEILERLLLFLASNTGSLFSAKKISDYLKSQKTAISVSQIQTFLAHLANAFIIHRVNRYDIVGKRLFEIGEKLYFENLGIRNAIWGYRVEDQGKIIENIVYNHLIIRGYQVSVGVLGNEEIDFICQKQGETLYVQVALVLKESSTIEREFGNLLKIRDNYPKIVVTLNGFQGNTYQGIPCISLRSFLLNSDI